MQSFSKRNQFENKEINLYEQSNVLNVRIVSEFINLTYPEYSTFYFGIFSIEKVMSECGYYYKIPESKHDNVMNAANLKRYLTNDVSNNVEWYDIYNFIEKSILVLRKDNNYAVDKLINEYNRILEEEGSLYRIVNDVVSPIINEIEIKEINKTLDSPYEAVNNHINKALSLLSNKEKPDYENSIKESISAVESICSVITKTNGKENTLGKTLDLLIKNGCNIHTSLKEAFKKIYGYTCDAGGIRHGAEIEKDAKLEEAIYMLISCSAFINYLISKNEYSK